MRVSSSQIFNIARHGMADVNQSLVKTQEQMSTGKRVLTPSDDPVAATKILQVNDELKAIEQYKKNIDIAQNNLDLEETVLGGVNNIIQRMQELAVAAGNTAALTPNEYRTMSVEVDERLKELMGLLNTKNAGGDYIFGGYKSSQPPFSGDALTGFRYHGDDGQQYIQVAHNTRIAASDSGKALFMDVASAQNTVKTSVSPNNQSNPPIQVSVGQVVDQTQYDEFYPKDMVITFNADSAVAPPGKNFTATERGTGRVIAANEPFVAGQEIELHGVSFRIVGNPVSGTAAQPATQYFGQDFATTFPIDFSPPDSQTFTMTVGGRRETLVLDDNITNLGDLAAVLNSSANGNAQKLTRLGITATNQGLEMPLGVNFSLANGSAEINSVMGLDTVNGRTSENGMQAQPGDRVLIESTKKQDILTTLARFQQAMANYEDSPEGRSQLGDVVANTLDGLGHAHDSTLEVITKVGARINTLESTRDLHLDAELTNKDVLSQLQDLDYAEAATRLSEQSLILQAAQQSFIRVSQLSLFSRM